jgi:hypothetical protein
MRYRFGFLLLAAAFVLGTAAPALAVLSPSIHTNATVPSNGAWLVYNHNYHHNPSPYYSSGIDFQLDDNIRNGILVGISQTGNGGYVNSYNLWRPDVWADYRFGDSWTDMYFHTAAAMYGSCGWVAPWDSCDTYWGGWIGGATG